jgi:FAD:protein FMN transferase
LEVGAHKISFKKPGMALTLNGIAQGFAGDLAAAALGAQGIHNALLNTGEWSAVGQSPQGSAWRLGIADPREEHKLVATLALLGRRVAPCAVATSSDAFCRFGRDDRHHHIFDPKTGDSPTGLASVTVVAPSCTLADAMTKVLFMGDKQNALDLAKKWQVEVLAVDKSGHWLASSGLNAIIAKS